MSTPVVSLLVREALSPYMLDEAHSQADSMTVLLF
jgi:hypothetical protein